MPIEFSPEQTDALRQGRGDAVDASGQSYVIYRKDIAVHLEGIAHDADQEAKAALRNLVQQGIDSGDYQPADQVFAELRKYAEEISQPEA